VPLQSRRPTSVLIFFPKSLKFVGLRSVECITYLLCLV
jgi:hypothetical protein